MKEWVMKVDGGGRSEGIERGTGGRMQHTKDFESLKGTSL